MLGGASLHVHCHIWVFVHPTAYSGIRLSQQYLSLGCYEGCVVRVASISLPVIKVAIELEVCYVVYAAWFIEAALPLYIR